MNNQTSTQLIQIMQKVLSHPISKIFMHPINMNSQLDLTIISQRVFNRQYNRITDFYADVKQLLIQAKNNNEKINHYSIAANSLYQVIVKELFMNGKFVSSKNWCEKVYKIRTKVKELIDNPPKMKLSLFTNEIDFSRPIGAQLPSDQDLKNLITLSQYIGSPGELDTVYEIIEHHQPGIIERDTQIIDVRKFSLPTVNDLLKFMKKKIMQRQVNVDEIASILSSIQST